MTKGKKKYIFIIAGFVLLLLLGFALVKYFIIARNEEPRFSPPIGRLRDGALGSELIEAVEEDGRYPDYYGGCYLRNQNLVILLTTESKEIEEEVLDIVGQKEYVYFQYVTYSLNELKETQEEFHEKIQQLYDKGDERTIKLLQDVTGSRIDEEYNRVEVTVKNYSWFKVQRLKRLLGRDERVLYEEGGTIVQ